MTTSAKQTSLFGEDESTSSQVDSLANRTAWQGSDKAQKMLDISGRKCLEQFESAGRPGLWARTFLGLLIGQAGWFSSRCALTWKVKGTKYNRLYCQLQVSTLHTEGIGSGLLPTARVGGQEGYDTRLKRQGHKKAMSHLEANIDYQIRNGLLKTPTKMDGEVTSGLWNTPTSNDAKNATLPISQMDRTSVVGDILRTGQTGQLSPHFVLEMMGFPPDWTELPFLNGETNQSKPEGMP